MKGIGGIINGDHAGVGGGDPAVDVELAAAAPEGNDIQVKSDHGFDRLLYQFAWADGSENIGHFSWFSLEISFTPVQFLLMLTCKTTNLFIVRWYVYTVTMPPKWVWFKHILFITEHDKGLGRAKQLWVYCCSMTPGLGTFSVMKDI